MKQTLVQQAVEAVEKLKVSAREAAIPVERRVTAAWKTAKAQVAGLLYRTAKKLSIVLLASMAATATANLPVNLGTAGYFTILSKTGISTTGTTAITGDIGASPVAATYITGFGLSMDASNEFSNSSLVTGRVYAADYAPPTPAMMTTAISDMEIAYTDAAGRSTAPIALAASIGGMTLAPGLYKASTGVLIATDVTLAGGANDVWIFQIAQTLDLANGKKVILSGGAQAKNIFWQVAGQTTLGTTSVMNGNILDQVAIVMNTGAILYGKALAQTAVTLDGNTVASAPAPYVGPNPPTQGKAFVYPSAFKEGVANMVYNMAESGMARIRIWNERGDLVDSIEERRGAGPQKSRILIHAYAPGIYLYRITATYDSGRVDQVKTQKFLVTK